MRKLFYLFLCLFSAMFFFATESFSAEGEETPVKGVFLKSSYGVPFPGRYNHIGQAHFYFADTIQGTVNELSKHMTQKDKEEKCIQTVKIQANTTKILIDLSGKDLRGYNTLLKYIRFSLQENTSKMPREYLIPSFISDCCKACGIDGIKYYGGKDYSNYVTWDDGCFDFVANV